MRISRMPIEILGRFLSVIALAGTFSLFVLYTTDSAEARVVLSQCQRKHSFCLERCIMNNKTFDAGNACIKRTCDKQHAGCGTSSIGTKSGGGKLIQTNPGGSTGGGVLTQSPSKQSPSRVLTSQPASNAAMKKSHPTPTAEPKPIPPAEPKPTPTAEPKQTPATPTRNARDHRATARIGDDRSSPGVTKTRYGYEDAVKASRPGPSEARKPKIRDHRAQPNIRDHQGVDPATRSGPSEARKPNIRDHRAGAQSAGASPSVPPRTAGSGGRVCGISGTPPCQQQ